MKNYWKKRKELKKEIDYSTKYYFFNDNNLSKKLILQKLYFNIFFKTIIFLILEYPFWIIILKLFF